MDQQELKTRLEIGARAGAILVIALYVSGYLVVTFNNAKYGIVEFGLFRAKLLSAGFLLLVFVALPTVEVLRAWSLFGFKISPTDKIPGVDHPPSVGYLDVFISSWGFTFLLRVLVFADTDFLGKLFGAFFVILALGTGAIIYGRNKGRLRPKLCLLLMLTTVALGFGSLVLLKKWQTIYLLIWFLIVGFFAQRVELVIREPQRLKSVNWFSTLMSALGLFATFGALFYPNIRPAFGGGQPVKVTIQFTNSSPIDGANKFAGWLVDEGDSGYYIVRARKDHNAIFLPRALVSAVYFEQD